MENEDIAKELLEVLMEKMWFREGLPSEGWAVEKICNALVAAQITQADRLPCGHHKDAIVGDGREQWCVACESANR